VNGVSARHPRVVLAATEVPTVGGSSTASYDLFRRLAREGADVRYLNLVDEDDAAYYRIVVGEHAGNPARLPGVHHGWLQGPLNEPHPELTGLLTGLDAEVAVAFGFLATILVKKALPSLPVLFVTGTCRNAQDHVTSGRVADAVSLSAGLEAGSVVPRILNTAERQAVELCDLLLTHSASTQAMIQRFFPASIGKIHPEVCAFAEWICEGAAEWLPSRRPFADRDIDVLFVASEWTRREKNYPFVRRIAGRLAGARVHVVGDVPEAVPGVTHHGFVAERATLFDLYGRARVVACPSLIDAAPGALHEAAVMGCNVVASKNCGNWTLCHPDLVVAPFEVDGFVTAIRCARDRRYEDRLCDVRLDSYELLRGLIAALAQPIAARRAP
jgi:glycosyltransferase involved in cell wall biosynthesis